MCICFWGYPTFIFYQLFFLFFDVFQIPISIRIDTLCLQRILQFPPIVFKLCILVLHGLKMCMWFWDYPTFIFYQLFPPFDFVFSDPISIGIDTLWAQLLLQFSTNHFETIHICSTWSEDVHVVFGLSSYHTDLKVTTLYWHSHDVWGRLPATGFYNFLQ